MAHAQVCTAMPHALVDLTLEEPLTAGYLWVVDEAALPTATCVETVTVIPPPDAEGVVRVGGPRVRRWVFRAPAEGVGRVRLVLMRPWLGPQPNDRRHAVDIQVTAIAG